jgi:hypothetical protein
MRLFAAMEGEKCQHERKTTVAAQPERESWMAQRMRGCFDSNSDHSIHKRKNSTSFAPLTGFQLDR